MSIRYKVLWGVTAFFMVSVITGSLCLAQSSKRAVQVEEEAVVVDFFDAIDKGLIEVNVTAHNANAADVAVKNKTKDHLHVNLPSTFALVPVLPQRLSNSTNSSNSTSSSNSNSNSNSNRNNNSNSNSNNSGNQSSGGGYGNSNSNSNSNNNSNSGYGNSSGSSGRGGGSYYNIAPEKVVKEKLRTVCLEHGKKDPSPRVKYAIKPLNTVTQKKDVQVLCEMLGNDYVDIAVAQAAAWNLNSEINWEDLYSKKYKPIGGRARPYFDPAQLDAAQAVIAEAQAVADERAHVELLNTRLEIEKKALQEAEELEEQ